MMAVEPVSSIPQDLRERALLDRETGSVPVTWTLLDLVHVVQDHTESDEEAVAVISHLLATRRVALRGIFAGARLRVSV